MHQHIGAERLHHFRLQHHARFAEGEMLRPHAEDALCAAQCCRRARQRNSAVPKFESRTIAADLAAQ